MDPVEQTSYAAVTVESADRLASLAEHGHEGDLEEVVDGLDRQIGLVESRIAQCSDEANTPVDVEVVRQECRRIEQELGIHSISERMAEALLFIDAPFLGVSALRGDEHPEELFGIEAWRGWLKARLRMRSIDRLSIDDILDLHADLAGGMPDARPGQFRSDASWGSDYVSKGTPISLDQSGFEEISRNPYVRFLVTGPGPHTGYIDYPSLGSLARLDRLADEFFDGDRERLRGLKASEPLLEELLQKVLERVKYPPLEGGDLDSRTICEQAARLQKDLVSIHPFNDCNGRLSRLIMNWYLEKHGLPPAILKKFDNDIVTPMDLWTNEIDVGTRRDRSQHPEARTPAEELFHPDDLEFYNQCYKKYYALPPDASRLMRLDEYKEYLDSFAKESIEFGFLVRNDHIPFPEISARDPRKEYGDLHVGGLIPEEYIEMWGDTRPERQEEIRRRFCNSGATIYRGVELAQPPSDYRDLLIFFQKPVAATVAYRPLAERLMSPKSARPVDKERVRATLRTYNEILIRDFLTRGRKREEAQKLLLDEKQLGDRYMRFMVDPGYEYTWRDVDRVDEAIRSGRYLAHILGLHEDGVTNSALWLSPGVSTSLSLDTGKFWINRRGVLLEALAPEFGGIYLPTTGVDIPLLEKSGYKSSFATEQELTVMGALDPNSITKVICERDGSQAVRDLATGDIMLSHRMGGSVERWSFNDSGELEYVETVPKVPSLESNSLYPTLVDASKHISAATGEAGVSGHMSGPVYDPHDPGKVFDPFLEEVDEEEV